MDTIFISELKVSTHLGVPDWERLKPQTIVLDIEIGIDLSAAGRTDAIADTIDYGAVVTHIHETLKVNTFKLVEALAEHVCELIFAEFDAKRVKIRVAKPGILAGLKALGIVIERDKTP